MNLLTKIYIGLRNAGLKNTLKTIQCSLTRDRLDKRYLPETPAGSACTPGPLIKAGPVPSGGVFQFERAVLEICFLSPTLARISWEPGEAPLPYALQKQAWDRVETILLETGAGWVLSSDHLEILTGCDGSLQFFDGDRHLLRSELPPFFQRGKANSLVWTHRALLSAEECVYGLGEQAGRLNLRGGSFTIWNSDAGGSYGPGAGPLYLPLPVYLGLHRAGSYLVFFENSCRAALRFGALQRSLAPQSKDQPTGSTENLAEARFEGGMLRYYFTPGPAAQALQNYSELTGRAPLPPRWSLGYHQCRWGYKTEQDIRQVAAGFLEQDMPVSAIHLDIDYLDGYRVFTVDKSRFPNLTGLAQDMAQAGIHLVSILDPGVKKDEDFPLYRQGIARDLFCKRPDGRPYIGLVWPGETAFPDFTNPETRRWWGEQYAGLLEQGISGFWHDMNEPSSFNAWGDLSLPLSTRHHLEGCGGDHRQAHNLYGLLMNRAGYEALQRLSPERRPWILTRSGWAGVQRYAWSWTGDTESTWAALRMTIPTVLGMGLSGLPYSGPDIGGHNGNPSAELYLRWFQLAAFLPFFRTHSTTGMQRREPWVFGEPYTTILRQFLKLRCRLMPYFYTLAWQASQTGHPIVRPLFWGSEADENLWEVDDAFLLGEALLVAPALEQGLQTRPLALPPGAWYDFWDDTLHLGPAEIQLQLTLERVPLLVRAGCILPMQEGDRLALHLYAPQENTRAPVQTIYSDNGDGYGKQRLDTFTIRREQGILQVEWAVEGNFPFPYSEVELHLHGWQARQAVVDGVEISCVDNQVHCMPFNRITFQA